MELGIHGAALHLGQGGRSEAAVRHKVKEQERNMRSPAPTHRVPTVPSVGDHTPQVGSHHLGKPSIVAGSDVERPVECTTVRTRFPCEASHADVWLAQDGSAEGCARIFSHSH